MGTSKGVDFNYHHNVLLSNDTTFTQYYDSVKNRYN